MEEGLTTKRRVRGNPLQYSCLENAWTEEPGWLQSTGSQSDTRKQLGTVQLTTRGEHDGVLGGRMELSCFPVEVVDT